MTEQKMEQSRKFEWCINLSTVLGTAWLAFTILWLAFYAGAYTFFQNLAILFVAFILFVGIIGALWDANEPSGHTWVPKEDQMECCATEEGIVNFPNQSWRIIAMISGTGWLTFLIIWFGFYAGVYTLYQNFTIFWGSLVIIALSYLVVWAVLSRQSENRKLFKQVSRQIERTSLLGVAWLIFLTVWYWFYADAFNSYQNLAIFLVSLLFCGALISVVWVSTSR